MTIEMYAGWPSFQAWVDAGMPGSLNSATKQTVGGRYDDWKDVTRVRRESRPVCMDCGVTLADARSKRCASCWRSRSRVA